MRKISEIIVHCSATAELRDFGAKDIDYASYVILERAIPHIEDGLKPVQRRILHVMKESDDGRRSKVAGIVGDTMHYHPHGDASIYSALVQLGQKELLIDTQGNWGSFNYYMSEPIRDNDAKGVGPFIWASLEMEQQGLNK